MRQSSVVITVKPPVSMAGQLSAWAALHRISPSWWRTWRTNWGASQRWLAGGEITTGSCIAAS